MRISVDTDDPGFANFSKFGLSRIYLDGQEIDKVITADEEQGFVVRIWLDGSGKPFIDKATGTLQQETLHGTVKIEPVQRQSKTEVANVNAEDKPII